MPIISECAILKTIRTAKTSGENLRQATQPLVILVTCGDSAWAQLFGLEKLRNKPWIGGVYVLEFFEKLGAFKSVARVLGIRPSS